MGVLKCECDDKGKPFNVNVLDMLPIELPNGEVSKTSSAFVMIQKTLREMYAKPELVLKKASSLDIIEKKNEVRRK